MCVSYIFQILEPNVVHHSTALQHFMAAEPPTGFPPSATCLIPPSPEDKEGGDCEDENCRGLPQPIRERSMCVALNTASRIREGKPASTLLSVDGMDGWRG